MKYEVMDEPERGNNNKRMERDNPNVQ